MLESAVNYHKVFDLVGLQDSKFSDELTRVKMRRVPTDDDWDQDVIVLPFVKISYDPTKVISCSSFVTRSQRATELQGKMKRTLMTMFEQYKNMGNSQGMKPLPNERATNSSQPSQQQRENDFFI